MSSIANPRAALRASKLALMVLTIAFSANSFAQTKAPAKKAAAQKSKTTAGQKKEIDDKSSPNDLPTPLPAENQVVNPATDTVPGEQQLASPDTAESENRRMRALEGSKSRFSGQFNLSYSGSTVDKPFSALAPNPDNDSPAPEVGIGGTVAGRYRLSPVSSIGANIGVELITPFQDPKDFSMSDPGLDYAYSYKSFGAHNRFSLGTGISTTPRYRDLGYAFSGSIGHDSLWELGKSGATFGLSTSISTNTFDKTGPELRGGQENVRAGVYPFLEYRLNDRLNLRSVVGFMYRHMRSQEAWDFTPLRVYQTLGLGISVTDDFFVYSFVRFYPSPLNGISKEESSVGFNLIANLF